MSRISQAVSIPSAAGNARDARLDLPTGAPPRAYALLAHCFSSEDSVAAASISEALTDAGIAVLRVDFTRLCGSEGKLPDATFSSGVADLVAGASWLRRERQAPSMLVGHGLGGAAVLAAAASVPEAVAVATINAPADQPQLAAAIAALSRALIVFHATRDATVGIDNASTIFAAAKQPKSLVSLDDADHLLTSSADGRYVGGVLAAWARRYLPARVRDPRSPDGPRDVVLVTETRVGKFQQEIAIGPHRLLADEPGSAGGEDTGPSPYDLLTAALGACTAMTVRFHAELKGMPLERVRVNLRHDKVHASDCAECETREGRIDRIERVIDLEGPLDEAARAKLLEIADKCPVHRTLRGEVYIPTRLVDAAG